MKYVATSKDQPIHSVTLAGKEYKAKDGAIEVPDDHPEAHAAAEAAGLTHAPAHGSEAQHQAKEEHHSDHVNATHGRRSK